MIVLLIMVIWFGYTAKKAGKNVIGWGLSGATLTFAINTILANLGVLCISGSLSGPIQPNVFKMILIVSGIVTIISMVIIGKRILPVSNDTVTA